MAKRDGDVNVIVLEGSGSFYRGRGDLCRIYVWYRTYHQGGKNLDSRKIYRTRGMIRPPTERYSLVWDTLLSC